MYSHQGLELIRNKDGESRAAPHEPLGISESWYFLMTSDVGTSYSHQISFNFILYLRKKLNCLSEQLVITQYALYSSQSS
jgi:hypothetical protein